MTAFAARATLAILLSTAPVVVAQIPTNRQLDEVYPILFVTQVPVPEDFTTIGSVFGNHRADPRSAPRGGDLWRREPDGTLRNLTAAAGFGSDGFQGRDSIAVRDPSVHWDGRRAVFSMIVGATEQQYRHETRFWQLYEIRGMERGATPVITRVPNQPADANNVAPIYGTDDRIVFASDRPRDGKPHLYPQLDEYEEAPTVTGLWSLEPSSGDLFLLVHAPSGDFTPTIDSFGRVIFTQWDHLQRDQQADADDTGNGSYGTFDWSDESAASTPLPTRTEVFPEPRPSRRDLLAGTNLAGHTFNHFFPWMVNEDGTELETLLHIGRHELHSYFDRALTDDPNVREFIAAGSGRANGNALRNVLQVREDPRRRGVYWAIDAPEFYTHAAGQVVRLRAPSDGNPDRLAVDYVTHRDTADFTSTPGPDHSGLYRQPLPLASGEVIVVHTAETDRDVNVGSRAQPRSRYDFRLKRLVERGAHSVAGAPLTSGIVESVSYWDPDVLVTYSGPLWELDPVEVRPRRRPRRHATPLPAPERAAFAQAGVDEAAVRAWLAQRDLALIVSRNLTTRDRGDRQQPFNLQVAGSGTRSIGAPGKIYEIAHLQLFQADQLRGIGGASSPRPGRRVLARALHDPAATNPPNPTGPAGSVVVAPDGSAAAFVPARRALSWQLTDRVGTPVVRERYWLSFQPGEIRSCTSCHGLNTSDQAALPEPTNTPQALRQLLEYWKTL